MASDPAASRVSELEHVFITEVEPAGPGPRLAIKDLFDTAGIRTTYGSAVFADNVPDADAAAVRRLLDAGFVNVGKANLHEFAWGITSENDHYGWVPNPAAPGRTPGGSSGGNAAALAAGLADYGLGTDSGGSIRIPAACCGVTGFKPTHGLVPLDGCFPLAPSYDHAGPMARDVDGCIELMRALAPELDLPSVELDELAVGIAWTEYADPLVRARVEEAARGAHPVALPLAPAAAYPVFQREAAQVHKPIWREHAELYGANVAAKLEKALAVSDAEYERALRERELYRDQVAAAMEGIDLVITPTLTSVAPRSGLGDLATRDALIRLTLPWNTVGAPALAMPCGSAEDGLPASLQLVGRPGADGLVLAAGRELARR